MPGSANAIQYVNAFSKFSNTARALPAPEHHASAAPNIQYVDASDPCMQLGGTVLQPHHALQQTYLAVGAATAFVSARLQKGHDPRDRVLEHGAWKESSFKPMNCKIGSFAKRQPSLTAWLRRGPASNLQGQPWASFAPVWVLHS